MCYVRILIPLFFLSTVKDFLSSAEHLQESLGLFLLLFPIPHTLTQAPPPPFFF